MPHARCHRYEFRQHPGLAGRLTLPIAGLWHSATGPLLTNAGLRNTLADLRNTLAGLRSDFAGFWHTTTFTEVAIGRSARSHGQGNDEYGSQRPIDHVLSSPKGRRA